MSLQAANDVNSTMQSRNCRVSQRCSHLPPIDVEPPGGAQKKTRVTPMGGSEVGFFLSDDRRFFVC